MAFSEMNDVDQDLGEARPGGRNNRNFMIIAAVLAGIMVLALLCIAGLALFKYLPGQSAAQKANATNVAQATGIAFAATQTSSLPQATNTKAPTAIPPTKTVAPTNTAVIIIEPTKSPTFDAPMATIYAMRTQRILQQTATLIPTSTSTSQATPVSTTPPATAPTATSSPTARPTLQPTARQTSAPSPTALPQTGLAEEMGTTGLIIAGFVLAAIIFLMRRLRTSF